LSRTRVLPPLSLQDIFTQDIATIAADASLSAALDQMTKRRIRSVLVHEAGALVGILTGHDLIRAAARGTAFATPVAALMSHPVLHLPAHTRLASAYGRMRRTGLRHLVVTGRDGTPAGIVSETDFFLHLSAAQLIGALTVADVMDPNPAKLGPDATLAQVLVAVATAPSDCAVLTHGSQPLVIVTEGSLLARLHEGADLVTTRLIDQPDQVPALATIATGASLPEARALFQSRQVRTLAVVHRDGSLAGVLDLRALIGVALPDRGDGRAGAPATTAPSRVRLRQFQRAVQQSPVSVIITDTDGTIEYVNPRFCEVTGYREDEVLGRNPRVLKSGAQDASFYQALWRAISAGRVWKGEFCNRRRDASLYWEAATISPVRDDRGDIVNFVAVKEDITARKRAVQALRESESKYRGLIASLSGEYLLYRRELDGPMTYLSPSVEHMTGYTPAELEGPWIGHLTDHPLNQSALETSRRALEGARQEPYDIEIRVKSGEVKRLRVSESPLFNPQGEVVAVQGIAQDVTELHRTRVLLDGRSRVLERLARGRPQAEVLEAITVYIAEAQPGAIAAVYLLDQDGVRLWLGAAPALPAHLNRALDGSATGPWVGACANATDQDPLVVCEDIRSHPDWAGVREILLTTELRACWSHPIRGRSGRVLGTFAIYHRESRRPGPREREIIASAVDLAAVVLDHFQAQVDLGHAEERERLLLISATEGVLGVDRLGVATFVNPAAARMLGYLPEELTGTVIHDRIHRPTVGHVDSRAAENHPLAHCPLVAPALDGRARHGIRETLYRRDGSAFPVELWSNPVLIDGQLTGAAVTFRDISERLEQEQRIHFLAFHDALTGLPNRNLLRESLDRELARLRRHDTPFALYLLDLDHFKDVNDSLGHPAGDELLQVVAERLRAQLRAEDSVARMGGDEFAIIQSYTGGADGVERLANRLVDALARPIPIRGREIRVGASLGVVMVNIPLDADTLMAQADVALYEAKGQGRNRYALFQPDMARALERELEIVGSLSQAIANGDLHLVYQPQVRIGSGALYAVEALVRWHHRRLGALLPGDFVPILERRGTVARLDGWVLRQAARQARDWTRRGCSFGRLAVNLSTLYPDDGQGAATPPDLIRRHGGNPEDLELELTERMLTRETYGVAESIAAIRGAGMGIAIDDFGTGYASLSYLRRFNPRTLKIDRALVADMAGDQGAAELVKAAIALGRALGLALVAEGVEESAQADYLLAHGCELAQGYLYGAVLEIEAFDERYFADCAPTGLGLGAVDSRTD